MGEGRGKLEELIRELEAKKTELQKLIAEYELMLPHLTSARDALDEAGITDSGSSAPTPPPAAAVAAAAAETTEPVAEPVAEPEAPAAEAEAAAPAPGLRSIASLVAEEDSAGDEATH